MQDHIGLPVPSFFKPQPTGPMPRISMVLIVATAVVGISFSLLPADG